ncbi:methylamine utilization protein [Halovibrio salipaludis]|uniref:Methylamine utilization protein n=1 Tax=Halovibrio salipaludis TaxID=2032626 RepID=A0A2A2FAT8_9GAMM|nr:methylamine utilization protein [Halovibrio salipaludis]PAU81739.1 methylamine utilization protein [Halovibrio salipaludis]
MRSLSPRPLWFAILGALVLPAVSVAESLTITVLEEDTSQPVEGAVVTLPGANAPSPGTFTIAQEDRAFQPGVLVIPAGSEVNFPNRDNTQHHVYSFSSAKTFDIELYAGEPESPIHFDQSGIVEIGCNIHDHMQGFILVTDRPHYGRTDANGEVVFERASGGSSQSLNAGIWHPRLTETGRFLHHSFTPGDEPRIAIALEAEAEGGDELDQLQQEFQDL